MEILYPQTHIFFFCLRFHAGNRNTEDLVVTFFLRRIFFVKTVRDFPVEADAIDCQFLGGQRQTFCIQRYIIELCVELIVDIFFAIVVIVVGFSSGGGDKLKKTVFFLLPRLGVAAAVLRFAAAVFLFTATLAYCPVIAAAAAPETALCAAPGPCTSSM
jgi:hypothetical protein